MFVTLRCSSLPALVPDRARSLHRSKHRLLPGLRRGLAAGLLAMLLPGCLSPEAAAQKAAIAPAGSDVGNLSLESLSSIEITSVSKRQQKLTDAAGAIFVISSEDIRRSGLSNIAELLRTVPGIDVAEIDANKWSITSRGFGERYPDKMLVLLDGRTLYSPLNSGINWDVQETLLEDVDRIEVIRGPGATLWGANAVNGVVNIITKSTRDTLGKLVRGEAALRDRSSGATRVGGRLPGSSGTYRVFAQYFDRDGLAPASPGVDPPDGWHDARGGFRADWDLAAATTVTVQGELFRGRSGTIVPGILSITPPLTGLFVSKTDTSGGDLIARWSKTSPRLDSMVQGYFDLQHRNELAVLTEHRHTFDLELVERFRPHSRHDLLFGGDFRYNADQTVGSLNISFSPAGRNTQLYGVFAQDEIALAANALKLTLGAKLEHNFYSGFALQPNVRLIWTPGERTSTWIAISRASESSSRTDADVRTNENPHLQSDGTVAMESDFGAAHLPPETVKAFEAGSRLQLNSILSFDLATFFNHYSNRHTNEPGAPYVQAGPVPITILPTYVHSNIFGETHGLELSVRAHPAKGWILTGSYTPFQIHLHQSASSLDFQTASGSETSTPRQKFQLHSTLSLPRHLEFDSNFFHVGRLLGQGVPAYSRLDLRAGWRPNPSLELSAGGRNLLTPQHAEFPSGELVESQPIRRSAFLEATWRF